MKKIAVDTNILVRLLAEEETDQGELVWRLLAENTIIVISTVLLETEWVLRSQFRYDKATVFRLIFSMMGLENLVLEERDRTLRTLEAFRKGMDFADAFPVCGVRDVDAFLTFDRDLARRAKTLIDHVGVALAE